MNNLSVSDLQLLADALDKYSECVLVDDDASAYHGATVKAGRLRFLLSQYDAATLLLKRVKQELYERSKGGVK